MSDFGFSIYKDRLVSASWFRAGTATAIIVITMGSSRLAGYPVGGEDSVWGWLPLSLGCFSRLASLLLCGWLGLLLRHLAFPKPHIVVQIILLLVMAVGIGSYGLLLLESDWLWTHYENMMVAGIAFGYLLPVSFIKPHNAVELIVMAATFAVLYSVCCLLDEYQWVKVLLMLGFLYEMLLLSLTGFAKKCVHPRWVQIIIILIAAASFLNSLRTFFFGLNNPRANEQLFIIMVQPVTVWLSIQLIRWIRPKKECPVKDI